MALNTVIFDMDGLLIDSEPYWEEAGAETLEQYKIQLTPDQYHSTTGLRTREWIEWWFGVYEIDRQFTEDAERTIITKAIDKIREHAKPMPGVDHIFKLFKEEGFKIGLATSSPLALVDVVAEKLGIADLLEAVSSAELLPNGKPHPLVYLQCAEKMNSRPIDCICFEDSFNGMIAAKAARMKCVVIPAPAFFNSGRWDAADLKIPDLQSFTVNELRALG
jgi:HAD superfamily hydrolase (TIGR01509 family)